MEGLDEALLGLSAEDSKTFTSTLVAGDHAGEEAEVTVTVHEGGSIVLTPIRAAIDAKTAGAAAKRLIKKNAALFKRLS